MSCIFCQIVDGHAPASVVYEDADVMCFMTLRPTRPGECLVIPRRHIDHFTDVPPSLLTAIMEVVRRVGRAQRAEFEPDRVGLIVHGYGVPHAHFIVLPQHHPHDITSGRFAVVEDGDVHFRHTLIDEVPRAELDERAQRIRARMDEMSGAEE